MRNGRDYNIVMIADDDLFMRGLIKKGIGNLARTEEIMDGAQVSDAYKKLMPDMLFLDIHMPNIMGMELLRELARFDAGSYIIMISSDSSESNVRTAMHLGARGFLTKPFQKERLQHFLNKCPHFKFSDQG